MSIPPTGQIAMSAINVELGRSSTAQISLDTAENGGYATINVNSTFRPNGANPAAMSEWRKYNHTALPLVTSQTITWQHFRGGPTGGSMQIRKNGLLVGGAAAAPPITTNGSFTAVAGDNISVRVLEAVKTPDYCEIYVSSDGGFEISELQYDALVEVNFVVQTIDGNYNIQTRQDPFI
jgi:hypothetical protein